MDPIYITIVLVLAVVLTGIYYLPLSKHPKVWEILLAALVLIVVSLVGSVLTGRNFIDVLTLEKAYGFGRAYILGLGIMLSGFLIFIINKVLRR